MPDGQFDLDLRPGGTTAGQVLDRIRRESRDEAAALALGLSPDVLADWRRRLAAEPTVSNRPAPGPA